jgi:hypothetical protein
MPVIIATNKGTSTSGLLLARLAISSREEDEEQQHVVQIEVLSTEQALALQRLTLQMDASGCILQASDAPQALFGFRPAALVGQNLASCLDVFRLQQESELQAGIKALAARWALHVCTLGAVSARRLWLPSCASGMLPSALVAAGCRPEPPLPAVATHRACQQRGASYPVGVHPPQQPGRAITGYAATLLSKQTRPAMMQVTLRCGHLLPACYGQ